MKSPMQYTYLLLETLHFHICLSDDWLCHHNVTEVLATADLRPRPRGESNPEAMKQTAWLVPKSKIISISISIFKESVYDIYIYILAHICCLLFVCVCYVHMYICKIREYIFYLYAKVYTQGLRKYKGPTPYSRLSTTYDGWSLLQGLRFFPEKNALWKDVLASKIQELSERRRCAIIYHDLF